MTVAVVGRFLEKQKSMYGLSAGPKKSGRCREVAGSGGSTVETYQRITSNTHVTSMGRHLSPR